MATQLLDGECKGTATDTDIGFMALHCIDQSVTQDVALCMLMTSDQFKFYQLMKKQRLSILRQHGHPARTSVNSINYALCSKFYLLHFNVSQWEFQISYCFNSTIIFI